LEISVELSRSSKLEEAQSSKQLPTNPHQKLLHSSFILPTGSLTNLLKIFQPIKSNQIKIHFSILILSPNQAGGPHERAVYETPVKPLIVA
jgi:hypothetical protein